MGRGKCLLRKEPGSESLPAPPVAPSFPGEGPGTGAINLNDTQSVNVGGQRSRKLMDQPREPLPSFSHTREASSYFQYSYRLINITPLPMRVF